MKFLKQILKGIAVLLIMIIGLICSPIWIPIVFLYWLGGIYDDV